MAKDKRLGHRVLIPTKDGTVTWTLSSRRQVSYLVFADSGVLWHFVADDLQR